MSFIKRVRKSNTLISITRKGDVANQLSFFSEIPTELANLPLNFAAKFGKVG